MFVHPKSKNELVKIIESNDNVIIDFYADWCGPCKKLAEFLPTLPQFNNFIICKIRVDDHKFVDIDDLTGSYNVSGLPTLVFYKSGTIQKKIEGANFMDIQNTIKYLY